MKYRLFSIAHASGKRAVMVCTEPMTLQEAESWARKQFNPENVLGVTHG